VHLVFISTMESAPWGGSEELWSQAASRLRQEGHHVMASVAWRPRPSPKLLALQAQGIGLFVQPRPTARWPVKLWRTAKRRLGCNRSEFQWLRRQKADLAVVSQGCNWDGLEWMSFCSRLNVPFMAIVQCNSEIWWPNDERRREMAQAYRAAKKVFCVSRHNLELLKCQTGESLSNAEVVWNPFNVPADRPPAWPKQNGVWKLGCVARLDPAAKGQDLLIQVLSQSKWRARPIEVNFYGTGPCEQSLKDMASRLQVERIHFRGHTADVRRIWEENHLFVLPSRYEGLPLSLVEAMWCGRPAVVTDIGGNAEMCVDDETGFVAAAPAVNILDQTLERAWSRRDQWQDMGRKARVRAEQAVPKDPVGDFCRHLAGPANNNHD
jgi:glycosyltransferase involved in cell wall biosynthesis